MLRKLLVYIFVFTSLQAQAANVFACDMMGKSVSRECCCAEMQMSAPAGDPSARSADACCTLIAVVGADAAASDSANSAFKALTPDLQPQPIAADHPAATFPPLRYSAAFREVPPGSVAQFGTLTYLKTLRLRI